MKDEVEVLPRLLDSVMHLVDYYVIIDTGSTDNSKQLVKTFFDSYGIKGEIYDYPFTDFADSRNFALKKVKGKADFGFWIDCDEYIEISPEFTKELISSELEHADAAYSTVKFGETTYKRLNFFKTHKNFEWKHPVHEYLMCNDLIKTTHINSVNTIVTPLDSYDKEKYLGHAEILLRAVELENDPRDVFYLAKSYKDAGEYEKAIEWFKKRIEMINGFYEERYYSQFCIALCYEAMNKPYYETVAEYMKCGEIDGQRAEHYLNAAIILKRNDQFRAARIICGYAYGNYHKRVPERLLFLHLDTYNYKLLVLAKELGIVKE